MGLEQIQYLEEKARYHRREDVEETTTQAPIFTTSLKHCDIKEGQRAHFECRLIPVSDNTMKVEWFHNNVPIKFGSRFTETNNFGFVALDILQCLPEDSGTYTCRATNWLGQSITSGNLNVQCKSENNVCLVQKIILYIFFNCSKTIDILGISTSRCIRSIGSARKFKPLSTSIYH